LPARLEDDASMADFDINSIDEVIHGRLRLGVMAYLVGAGSADFTTLRTHLKASDGNLSVQIRKLEDAGYIAIRKSFRARKPLTEVSLTEGGRAAFLKYLESMSGLLR
jgi:DNA-binding MarR family transcriptional regulator